MKTLIIVLSVFLATFTVGLAQNKTKTTNNMEAQKSTYECPMHPGELSDKEGNCSKCGMTMIKTTVLKHNPAVKGSLSSAEVKTKYICKMDGETAEMAENCPKCGMKMTLANNEAQKTTYACPMHPEEMSDKQGNCSKCGMKMLKTVALKHNPAIKGSQNSSEVKTTYVCPMHPKEMSDKKGKCPKCGMDMTKMDNH